MLLRCRRSLAAVLEQRSAGNRCQAVAWEVAEGVAKAVLLIGSMAGHYVEPGCGDDFVAALKRGLPMQPRARRSSTPTTPNIRSCSRARTWLCW